MDNALSCCQDSEVGIKNQASKQTPEKASASIQMKHIDEFPIERS